MTQRICHVNRCTNPRGARSLMCREHWAQVPPVLKQAVSAHYRLGQERDFKITREYIAAARAALNSVSEQSSPPQSFLPDHVGRELVPGVIAHVAPDIAPEALEALTELAQAWKRQIGDGA
jgi:hypothetical protein